MKHKLLSDLLSDSDGSAFDMSADGIGASFMPSFQSASFAANAPPGVLVATTPVESVPASMPGMISGQAFASTGFQSVPITLGGITINLLFDEAAVDDAPASFRAGIEQAATLLAGFITDKITVNLEIHYTGTGRGAGALPMGVQALPYSTVRAELISHSDNPPIFSDTLPDTSTIQGQANVDVYTAQEKVWGLINPNSDLPDGEAIFATDIDPTLLAGVALHELTHALGRVPVGTYFGGPNVPTPDIFDLFRFTSPGVRLFQSYNGWDFAAPAYFSLDGGVTKLADYGEFSDPSDFKNEGVQGPNDTFNESYSSSTSQLLSGIDLQQLSVLGFHVNFGARPFLPIEATGSTRLDQVGLYYYLDPIDSGPESGPLLKLFAAPVFQGEAGSWAPIGAEQTATGYEVAWRFSGTDFYEIWNTDSTGNFVSSSGTVSGASLEVAAAEITLKQDLNGDGRIGPPNIEASGATRLDQFGNNYALDPVSGAPGPLLKFNGAAVTVGQFGSLPPIGAEQTASGYEVAWKVAGADQYSIWITDANGNYVSDGGVVSGTSLVLEAAELSFHQDLNGDGRIGPLNIEASGATRLDQFGNNYALDPISGAPGPLLKFNGAAVTVGQFGSLSPIGAEQTASGYEVAWKVAGADQYSIWITDANGNYVSDGGVVSGTSLVLEAAEVSFHQDLNGDGRIGIAPTTIETFGSTRLDLAGSAYTLDPVAGGAGPSLKYHGVAVLPGQFGALAPIGTEQTASGYEVAWKAAGADQYILWNTDSNGNYVSDTGVLSGTSLVLEAAEVSFHQDLNGDGRIGIAPTTIEAFGATKLDLAGSAYTLDPVAGGAGPSLKYHGAAVLPGQFGALAPIGAEQTASGYEVAWKATGADQYILWNTDGNGNYISDGGVVSGTSAALEAAEVSFHQDLNGDGIIGVLSRGAPIDVPPASGPVGDSFVFRPDLGTSPMTLSANANAPDTHTTPSVLLPDFSPHGPVAALEMLFQHASDSHDLFVSQDELTALQHVADLHTSVLIH
jgi:serralysin